jgi:uncharacterized membrane protein
MRATAERDRAMAENHTELLVMLFDDIDKADKALEEVKELARYKYLKVADAAVLKRDGEGKATLKETNDFSGKKGAVVGAVGGAVLALLGPVGWGAAAVGAAVGGVGGHLGDRGLPNEALEDLKSQLAPNTSMLVVQVEHEWAGTLKGSLETKPVSISSWQISLTDQSKAVLSGKDDTPPPTA